MNHKLTLRSHPHKHQQYRNTPILKFPLLWIRCEMLVLAAGLTDIISRMPTPPGKMKKTNHYVQWQQLKQLHKATYVGSYKPLVSRVGLCVSAEPRTFLTEPSLAETSTPSLKLSRPKPAQTDERAWHNGLHENKTLAYATVPLSEVECVFMCIFPKFAFLFGVPAACV